MLKKNRILFIFIIIITILSGCNNKGGNYEKPQIDNSNESNNYDDTAEWIEKSHAYRKKYQTIKTRLLNDEKITDADNEVLDAYIIGLFYESFDEYKKEMEIIFEKYSKYDLENSIFLLSLSLTIVESFKNGYIENYYDEILSENNNKWIMEKLDSIEPNIMSMDENSQEFKEVMGAFAGSKHVLYHRLGNKELEKKYGELEKKYLELGYPELYTNYGNK